MKDIRAILAEHNVEDSEAIAKEVLESYRSLAEIQKKDTRITELEEQNKTLSAKVSELDGTSEQIEALKTQIGEFEAKEKQRLQDEEQAAKREAFGREFETALNGRTFANELTRSAVFEKAYEMSSAGVDAKTAIESVTKGVGGVWSNPQRDPMRMPGADQFDTRDSADMSKRAFARELFGSKD